MFWGNTFIFDGIPSERFNLFISSPDGGTVETTGAGDVELITQEVTRRPKPYLLGVRQSPVLSFDVRFTSPEEIMGEDLQVIMTWLFGHETYKKLQIVQEDMQDIYYNCFITSPRVIRTGNMIMGVAGTVVCDAPYGFAFPKTYRRTYTTDFVSDTLVINNTSNNNAYEYPHVNFTINNVDGEITIKNLNDNDRTFKFVDLLPNENVDVDNELYIIKSASGLLRMPNFNKNWFRLKRGVNNLVIGGNVAELIITYSPARKVA